MIDMFFRNKTPKRLYIPTKSKWYTRPKRRPTVRSTRKLFRGNIRTHFTHFFKNAIYFTITGSILVVLIIFLFFSSYFSVTNIEVVREDFNIDSAGIENELKQYIGKNILFFSRYRIMQTIQKKFPEFSDVTVKSVFPHTLKIDLESYPIVASLRAYYILPKIKTPPQEFNELNRAIQELVAIEEAGGNLAAPNLIGTEKEMPLNPLENEEVSDSVFSLSPSEEITIEKQEITPIEQKCLLNRIGQAIFDQAENLELITITIQNLTQPIEDRGQAIPKKRMDFILDAIQYFNNLFGTKVVKLAYLPIAREIHLETDKRPAIWITMERDYKTQIDKLYNIYEPAELDKEKIAYIDLRIREKVIYCPLHAPCDSG